MLARSLLKGAESPVATIMTRDFEVVRDDLDVDRLARQLLARRVSCAAVSDAHGNLIGFVSMIDLVRDRHINGETEAESSVWTTAEGGLQGDLGAGFHLEAHPASVRDIMMPCVLRISANASIDEAAALMASEGVHRLVVVASKRVVGMISALDILAWLARRDGFIVHEHAKSRRRTSCEYAIA